MAKDFKSIAFLVILELLTIGCKVGGDETCSAQSQQGQGSRRDEGRKIICHIGLWTTEVHHGSFNGDILDPALCTHYVLNYYTIDRNQNKWKIVPPLAESQIEVVDKVLKLKLVNPNLRILIAIGGYGDNRDDVTKYADLTADETSTMRFVNDTLKYLTNNPTLDGIDFQWNYPGRHPDTDADAEREQLGEFSKHICTTLRAKGYICMITVQRPTHNMVDRARTTTAFAKIIKEADLVAIWTADIPPELTAFVEVYHTDLLYKPPNGTEMFKEIAEYSVEELVELFVHEALSPSDVESRAKLLMTIPMQANSFSLKKYNNSWTDSWPQVITDVSRIPPPPKYGERTNQGYETGLEQIPFFKVCRQSRLLSNNQKDKLFLHSHYTQGGVESPPVAYNKGHLVPTNTPQSVQDKVKYAQRMKLGGVSVFQISADDVKGWCYNETYPLLNAIFDQVYGLV